MPMSATSITDEYRADGARAVEICKVEGCRDVFIFGSVAAGRHRPYSDLRCPWLSARALLSADRSIDG